jgi:hypothetical protein
MSDAADGWKPKRQHRRHIYYKVQVYDGTSLTWRDQKDAFDEVASARAHIEEMLAGETTRIMVVDGRSRYPLDD